VSTGADAQAGGRRRRVDSLGRVVLPADLRHALGIREGDELDVGVDGSRLVLSKTVPGCVFCASRIELVEFSGKHVCRACLSALGAAR
jgi:AbrB family transcriptional regulator, transcriptional pleiotropic regulator of transition state genes